MSVGKTTRKGYPVNNVVATGEATSQIPLGKTLNNLQLQLGGTAFTKAMISAFKLRANGKIIVEGSGTQIDKINAYRGLTTNAAFLDIFFEDLAGLDQLDRFVGALDTSQGIANLTTEITIAGATAPTLSALIEEAAPQRDSSGNPSEVSGLMCKLLRYPFSVASGGQLPFNAPFGQNGAVIKRVHVFNTGGFMTGATVKEDSLVIHETTKLQNEYMQVKNGRVPQAGVYTVDFVMDGNMRNALDTRKTRNLEFLFDFSAADNGFILIEYLSTLNAL